MAIGQSWLADDDDDDDDGYDTSTPYYHCSVYGWYNGFVWWVRFLSTLHLRYREEERRSMGKAFFTGKAPGASQQVVFPLTIERTPEHQRI